MKKNITKILTIILLICCVFSLVACSNNGQVGGEQSTAQGKTTIYFQSVGISSEKVEVKEGETLSQLLKNKYNAVIQNGAILSVDSKGLNADKLQQINIYTTKANENKTTVVDDVTFYLNNNALGEKVEKNVKYLIANENNQNVSTDFEVKFNEKSSRVCNTTSPLIIGEYAYVVSFNTIFKLNDKGEKVGKKELAEGTRFGLTTPVKSGENIIVGVGSKIQALDQNLNILWTYSGNGGVQSNIVVDSQTNNIYVGYFSQLNKDSNFVALNSNGTKLFEIASYGGFNYGGCVIIDNYLVVKNSTATNNYIACYNKLTGEKISELQLNQINKTSEEDFFIESQITYDDSSKNLYFTASYRNKTSSPTMVSRKDAYVCKLAFDKNNGTFGTLNFLKLEGIKASSTPVIAEGRLYVSSSASGYENVGKMHVIDASSLTIIYSVNLNKGGECTPLLKRVNDGESVKNYLFFTQNTNPGALYYIVDKAGSTSSNLHILFMPKAENRQYCISSVIDGNNGKIYYHNDANAVFSIAINL